MPQPLTPQQLSLVSTANATIAAVPHTEPVRLLTDHTVSSAVLSSAGRIFTGVNIFHFTGGPCAEHVAFGNAAAAGVSSAYTPGVRDAEGNGETLVCCVAVASDGRGVISPCGKCRQIMLDWYPEIRVVVRGEEGELCTVGTDELLPFPYRVLRKKVEV